MGEFLDALLQVYINLIANETWRLRHWLKICQQSGASKICDHFLHFHELYLEAIQFKSVLITVTG